MNRRPDLGNSMLPAAGRRQLHQLLRVRRQALCREWRQAQATDRIDDDLLPAHHHVEQALVQVDLALERAQRGVFGRCQGCGCAIDFQRLLALPTAERCWTCQEAAERSEQADRPSLH